MTWQEAIAKVETDTWVYNAQFTNQTAGAGAIKKTVDGTYTVADGNIENHKSVRHISYDQIENALTELNVVTDSNWR